MLLLQQSAHLDSKTTGGKFAPDPLHSPAEPPPALTTPPHPQERGWGSLPPPLPPPLPSRGATTRMGGSGKPTPPRSPAALAAFSGIPKFGQSLFLQSSPPPPIPNPQLDAGLIDYLFISAFSQLSAHTGRGDAEAGSQSNPPPPQKNKNHRGTGWASHPKVPWRMRGSQEGGWEHRGGGR